jgi:hypothetical protein
LLAPQSNGGAFEGARDQPVQYMNYRRPVVQDSRPAVSATKTVDGEDKMQAYVQSKATGSFVKLSKEQLQDLEQQTGGADALNIEDLPTLDGADEVQAANLKLQQSTGNIFLFIHGCLAGTISIAFAFHLESPHIESSLNVFRICHSAILLGVSSHLRH